LLLYNPVINLLLGFIVSRIPSVVDRNPVTIAPKEIDDIRMSPDFDGKGAPQSIQMKTVTMDKKMGPYFSRYNLNFSIIWLPPRNEKS
jgi:hypothetical protein